MTSRRRRISTMDLKELCYVFRVHFVDSTTVGTSPQRPPWAQNKVVVVEGFKQESMHGLSA